MDKQAIRCPSCGEMNPPIVSRCQNSKCRSELIGEHLPAPEPQVVGTTALSARPLARTVMLYAALLAAVLGVIATGFVYVDIQPRPSWGVVTVRCGSRSGTGVFVTVPNANDQVFVLTSDQLVSSGESVSVVRRMEPPKTIVGRWLWNAYLPYHFTLDDVAIVDADPATGLALLRLNNLPPHSVRGIRFRLSENAKNLAQSTQCTLYVPQGESIDKYPTTVSKAKLFGELADPEGIDHAQRKMDFLMLTDVALAGDGYLGAPIVLDDRDDTFAGIVLKRKEENGMTLLGAATSTDIEGFLAQVSTHLQSEGSPPSEIEVQGFLDKIAGEYLAKGQTDVEYLRHRSYVFRGDLPLLYENSRQLIALRNTFGQLQGLVALQLAASSLSDFDFVNIRENQESRSPECSSSDGMFAKLKDDRHSMCVAYLSRLLAQDLMRSALRFNPKMSKPTYDYKVKGKIEKEAQGDWNVWSVAVAGGEGEAFKMLITKAEGKIWLRLFNSDGALYANAQERNGNLNFYGTWVRSPDSEDRMEIVKKEIGNERKSIAVWSRPVGEIRCVTTYVVALDSPWIAMTPIVERGGVCPMYPVVARMDRQTGELSVTIWDPARLPEPVHYSRAR